MRVLILSVISILFLSACGTLDRIETSSTPVERTPLDLAPADPVELSDPEWIVVTPDNADEVFKDLEESGRKPVVIALTSDGYERLSIDFSEIRQHINTQRNILLRYKEYYEDSSPPTSSDQ